MLSLVLIGYGPIASYVRDHLPTDSGVKIAAVLCRPGREDTARAFGRADVMIATDVSDLPTDQLDLAIDCAGHGGLTDHGVALLQAGVKVLSLSVGAMADPDLAQRLEAAAQKGKTQLEFATGAIGGIDALSSAKIGGLSQVRYVARKPPLGWAGTPAETVMDLATITKPTEHFRGPAREAALRYPKNANVAAMVALAGLGLDATEAVLIADPTAKGNHHAIEASGTFGTITIQLEGKTLPDNPKSSALAAMSMVRSILRHTTSIVI